MLDYNEIDCLYGTKLGLTSVTASQVMMELIAEHHATIRIGDKIIYCLVQPSDETMAYCFLGYNLGKVFEQDPTTSISHCPELPSFVPNEAFPLIAHLLGNNVECEKYRARVVDMVCSMFFLRTTHLFRVRYADGCIGYGRNKTDIYFNSTPTKTKFVSEMHEIIPTKTLTKMFQRINVGLEATTTDDPTSLFENTPNLVAEDDVCWVFGIHVSVVFGPSLMFFLHRYSRVIPLEKLCFEFGDYIDKDAIPNFRAILRRGNPDYYEVSYDEEGPINEIHCTKLRKVFSLSHMPHRADVYAKIPLTRLPAQKVVAKWMTQYPDEIRSTAEDSSWILACRHFSV